MLSKNQPLMGTDIKKPKSCTPRRNFRLPTYLRKPPRAALKIKSRNGEVSLQIEPKTLRLRRLVLAPAIHRKTRTENSCLAKLFNTKSKPKSQQKKPHQRKHNVLFETLCNILYPNTICHGKPAPNTPCLYS